MKKGGLIWTCALAAVCFGVATTPVWAAPNVTRMWFTPPVIPTSYVDNVRFEATVTESPASVAFEYNAVDRPMYDDGTHGDLVSGDGTWTIEFTANEIIDKLTPAWVHRPFIGYCEPAGGGRFNIFAEVWTEDIGLVDVTAVATNVQTTDYLVNFTATESQLMTFNASYWANQFYTLYGDKFDFLTFLHVAGKRGNRYHFAVKNDIQGIGLSIFDNTAVYGSTGRLMGCTVYPLSAFFDCGETTFSHETGHQWINFLSGTPFSSGVPHWPKGDVAINIMGFSLGGGVGGTYSYTFTTNGSGGYLVGAGVATNRHVYNSMELYLMGLVPTNEVDTFFVLNNQNSNLVVGQTLPSNDVTVVTVDDVIASLGPRVPASTNAQSTFRSATVVLSEELLDVYAMSLYDWFAQRAEAKERLDFASGFLTGTCNPFYLATGGRGVMFSKIEDDNPTLSLGGISNDLYNLVFTGKLGVQYHSQTSDDFVTWTNAGPPVTTPLVEPPGDTPVSIIVTTVPGAVRSFHRILCVY